MLLPLLGAAIPAIIDLVSDDSKPMGKRVLDAAAGVVTGLTGEANPDKAASIVEADPELFLKFQQAMTERIVALAVEETKQLEIREQSWREMTKSEKFVVYAARPYILWSIGTIGNATAAAIIYFAVKEPHLLAAAIEAIQWVVYALAGVAGYYVKKRSDDKAAGDEGAPAENPFQKFGRKLKETL